jgi:hypothetical protein
LSSRETPAPLFWTIVLLFAPPDFDLTLKSVWIWHLQSFNKHLPGQGDFLNQRSIEWRRDFFAGALRRKFQR